MFSVTMRGAARMRSLSFSFLSLAPPPTPLPSLLLFLILFSFTLLTLPVPHPPHSMASECMPKEMSESDKSPMETTMLVPSTSAQAMTAQAAAEALRGESRPVSPIPFPDDGVLDFSVEDHFDKSVLRCIQKCNVMKQHAILYHTCMALQGAVDTCEGPYTLSQVRNGLKEGGVGNA